MHRPKRLTLGAFDYEVRLDPDLATKASALGTCITDSLVILLDASMPDVLEAETLLHESLHGLWMQTSLAKRFSSEDEEYVIWQLSPLLFRLIRDNKEFVQWLTKVGR